MTEAEVTACQVKLDRILSEFDRPGLVGKVRQHAGWTDSETGEHYPPVWVAEIRYGRGEAMRVAILDTECWREDAIDDCWAMEIEELVR